VLPVAVFPADCSPALARNPLRADYGDARGRESCTGGRPGRKSYIGDERRAVGEKKQARQQAPRPRKSNRDETEPRRFAIATPLLKLYGGASGVARAHTGRPTPRPCRHGTSSVWLSVTDHGSCARTRHCPVAGPVVVTGSNRRWSRHIARRFMRIKQTRHGRRWGRSKAGQGSNVPVSIRTMTCGQVGAHTSAKKDTSICTCESLDGNMGPGS